MEFSFSCFIIDRTLAIKCRGDLLGIGQERYLLKQASDLTKAGCINCSIDLSDVRHMNSKGLSLLIRLLTMFRNGGGDMVLIRPTSKAIKLLAVTKLNKIFTAVDSRSEGLARLQKNTTPKKR